MEPHSCIRFSIDRRCEAIKTLQIRRPKPLPSTTDEKGVEVQWHLDEQQWTTLFDQAAGEARKVIESSRKHNPEEWQHAEQLGITDTSSDLGIKYAQWSIACERAALLINGSTKQQEGAISGEWASKGRGVMHTLDLKNIANRSSD